MKIGALEAGGTKMVCAIGNEEGIIVDRVTIPTQTPDVTMPQIIRYFTSHNIEALGIEILCASRSGNYEGTK